MSEVQLKPQFSTPIALGTKALLVTPMFKAIHDRCFLFTRPDGQATCIVAPVSGATLKSDLKLFGFQNLDEKVENILSFEYAQSPTLTYYYVAVIRENDVVIML